MKKLMNHVLVVSMLLIMLFVLTGCGNETQLEESTQVSQEVQNHLPQDQDQT